MTKHIECGAKCSGCGTWRTLAARAAARATTAAVASVAQVADHEFPAMHQLPSATAFLSTKARQNVQAARTGELVVCELLCNQRAGPCERKRITEPHNQRGKARNAARCANLTHVGCLIMCSTSCLRSVFSEGSMLDHILLGLLTV